MKIFFTASVIIAFAACFNPFKKTIEGNGNVTTVEKSLSSFKNIKCAGNFDVELTQGNASAIKIVTDDNLQSYIVTDVKADELSIHTKDDVNIRPTQKTKLYITTNRLEEFKLSGSGNISGTNKFSGGDHLELSISGNGSLHFNVNTPEINASISGAGDIYLTGETKDSKIEIAGSGNYYAEELKAENATIRIAGTGDAKLYAAKTLDINIAGVGNVYYKGNASVTQNIAGSGKIKKMD